MNSKERFVLLLANPLSSQLTNMLNLLRQVGTSQFITCLYVLLLTFGCSKPKMAVSPQKETTTAAPKEQFAFTIVNVLDFGRRDVRNFAFCPTTQQLFVSHLDQDDDRLYQWDVESKALLHIYRLGGGFICDEVAVSPDGNHLLVGCWPLKGYVCKTLLIDTRERRIILDLARPGRIFEARFDSNGKKFWMRTSDARDKGIVFGLDGTEEREFVMEDFPDPYPRNVWDVPQTKTPGVESGLFCKGPNGVVHLLEKRPWHRNYGITSDGKIVAATTWGDEIGVWVTDTGAQVFRSKTTNHDNGGGYLVYDPKRNRFLIGDCSYNGTTWLRALTIAKRQ